MHNDAIDQFPDNIRKARSQSSPSSIASRLPVCAIRSATRVSELTCSLQEFQKHLLKFQVKKTWNVDVPEGQNTVICFQPFSSKCQNKKLWINSLNYFLASMRFKLQNERENDKPSPMQTVMTIPMLYSVVKECNTIFDTKAPMYEFCAKYYFPSSITQ